MATGTDDIDDPEVPLDVLARMLDREYGIELAEPIRLLGGAYSENRHVLAMDGQWVARIYASWTDRSRLTGLRAVRDGVRAAGYPCPRPRSTGPGDPFAEICGRLVEVEEYVESDATMDTAARFTIALPLLGRMHALLADLPPIPGAVTAPYCNHIPAERLVEETAPAIATIRRWSLAKDEATLLALAEQLTRRLQAVRPDLPQQLVHGDFWHNNVLFRGSEVAAVLDYDFVGVRPRIDDLALTLFFVNEHLGRADRSRRRLDLLRDLVAGYDSGAKVPLSPVERRALPAAIARSPLFFLRDIARGGAAAGRRELRSLRGPEWEWAAAVLADPAWLTAFD
jgi:Ser/Thr protein kinase RdoA (MazF antagonist)